MANPLFSDAEIANISRLNQRDSAYKTAQSAGKDPYAATAQFDDGYRAPGNRTPRSSGGIAPPPLSGPPAGYTGQIQNNGGTMGAYDNGVWFPSIEARAEYRKTGVMPNYGGLTPPAAQPQTSTPTPTPSYPVTANMGMGGTPYPSMSGSAPSTPFPMKTPADIAAEAKARTDALLAKQTTIANQTKQGFQTSYDRLMGQTRDNRTLQDSAFQRNTNPFSGGTDFQRDMTGRQRAIEDSNAQQDLATRLANVDMSLADYANANESQRQQMIDDMTQKERAYGLQVDQLALQRRGQDLGQFNADRQYGLSQSDLALRQQGQSFTQGMSQADLALRQQGQNYNQFNADRNFNYGSGQDQIKNAAQYGGIYNPSGFSLADVNQRMAQNSAAWANASPDEQQRLHDENRYLASLKGSTYDPATGEYSQGNNYVGQPTLAAQNQQFNQNIASNEMKFKQDSYQQKFNEDVRQFDVKTAMEKALQAGQLNLQQYNAATSRMNANTSETRSNWDMSPNNPDNMYKQKQLDELGKPKPMQDDEVAKMIESSPLVQKQYDENGKAVGTTIPEANKQALAQYIASLGLPPDQAKKWFIRYGLWSGK